MSSETTSNKAAVKSLAIATAGATAYVTNTLGALAGILGFSAPGITAGSAAAGMMSAAATTGVGGGIISGLQSVGAAFALATGGGVLATTAAITVPIISGIAVYSLFSQKSEEKEDGTGPKGEEKQE